MDEAISLQYATLGIIRRFRARRADTALIYKSSAFIADAHCVIFIGFNCRAAAEDDEDFHSDRLTGVYGPAADARHRRTNAGN